jgi:hypothetical protein
VICELTVEVGVAEVRVGLSLVLNTGGSETERVDSPGEVLVPFGLPQGETFTDRRLVDLDSEDTSLLEVDDLVTESESELLALNLLGNIGTGEGPVEDGDGTGEHTLHGALGEGLSVGRPADGDGSRAGDVGDDDRGTNVSGSVRLNPGVLGEDESREVLSEVLRHVVTFSLCKGRRE